MNELNLLDDLVHEMRELFKGYTLLNKNNIMQEVKIFAQYMPQPEGLEFANKDSSGSANYSSSDMESNFPCIVIKLNECIDVEERRIDSTRVNVKFLIACYDDKTECQGYRDIVNISEKIRDYLLIERVINERFRLEMPMKSRLLDCETWPVYFGEIDCIFQSGRPVMRKDFVYERGA